MGDHEHEATPLRTLVVPHALSVTPPLMNRTVPVDVGPVTFAVSVYVPPTLGFVGMVPSAMDDVAHVVAEASADGRLVAPLSTGVTRVSYAVPASSPVTVTDVPAALAENVVHVESDVFLYSTLYPVTPVVSCGAVQERASWDVLPVETVPVFAAVGAPGPFAPFQTLLKSYPCRL